MTHSDQHGVEITATNPGAVGVFDRAVTEYLRIGNRTLKFLGAALEADPDLLMAHCATGYFQAFNTRWGVASGMHASLKEAERTLKARSGTPSEKLHVAALRALSCGNLIENGEGLGGDSRRAATRRIGA